MEKHTVDNNLWDDGQLGCKKAVLGTIDQLLVDECIMEEVRDHKRNLAVAYYDYKKAYDFVHHDWVLAVLSWMGFPDQIIRLIKELMSRWRTKLVVKNKHGVCESRWIQFLRGFLQGDSFSAVGYCLSEVPIGLLIKKSKGYQMGRPGNRDIARTHSLFIDDLKLYQKNHRELTAVNNTIVTASNDTGAVYGVSKCAEAVFHNGHMVQSEGLDILEDRMRTLDPAEDEDYYKFLGC